MAGITLELITPAEFGRYHDWFNEGAHDYLSGASESLTSMFEASDEPLAYRLVFGGVILAIITIAVSPAGSGKLNLVVDPRARRRGVGSAAIGEVLKRPEVRKLRSLESEVLSSNVAAQKILIKNGFVKTGFSTEGHLKFQLA